MSTLIILVCLTNIDFYVKEMYKTIFKSVKNKFNAHIKGITLFHVISILYFSYDQGVIHMFNIKLN